jgi:LysR family transcriptional regulator for metE and metH
VERRRLDIFQYFLDPAGVEPAAVRTSELTMMMVQLAANGRGVCALPDWVLAEYVDQGLITALPAGESGIRPTLYAAVRASQREAPFLRDFLTLAREHCLQHLRGVRPVTAA